MFFAVKLPDVTTLLKDQFLKKMFLKRAKPVIFSFCKTIGSNNSFTISDFKIAKFEFNVTIHPGLWAKELSSDPLKCFKYFKNMVVGKDDGK